MRAVSIVVLVAFLTGLLVPMGSAHAQGSAYQNEVQQIDELSRQQRQAFDEAINSGNFSAIAAGFARYASALVGNVVITTEEGLQFLQAQIQFHALRAAIAACREIPKRIPTLGGVGLFIACISPLNAAIIATAQQLSDLRAATRGNPGGTPLAPGAVAHLPIVAAHLQQGADVLDDLAVVEQVADYLLSAKGSLDALKKGNSLIDDVFAGRARAGVRPGEVTLADLQDHRELGDVTAEFVHQFHLQFAPNSAKYVVDQGLLSSDARAMASNGFIVDSTQAIAQSAEAGPPGAPGAGTKVLRSVGCAPADLADEVRSGLNQLHADVELVGTTAMHENGDIGDIGLAHIRLVRGQQVAAAANAWLRLILRERCGAAEGERQARRLGVSADAPSRLPSIGVEGLGGLEVSIDGDGLMHPEDVARISVLDNGVEVATDPATELIVYSAARTSVDGAELRIEGMDSALVGITEVAYIFAAHGDAFGWAQVSIAGTDGDGDLLEDSWERRRGLDPTSVDDALASLALDGPAPPLPRCKGRVATIVGTNGPDRIRGTAGPDIIVAFGGDDDIDGRGGNDVICAGSGHDMVKGGAGADQILAQSGNDTIVGGKGNDRVWGGGGNDVMSGGAGNDALRGQRGRDAVGGGRGPRDTCLGGPGKDQRRPGCEVAKSF